MIAKQSWLLIFICILTFFAVPTSLMAAEDGAIAALEDAKQKVPAATTAVQTAGTAAKALADAQKAIDVAKEKGNDTTKLQEDLTKVKNDLKKSTQTADTIKFAGINFGVGVSLTLDIGTRDRVEDASVVNGIVRVNKQNNDVPRVLLESHYFFLPSCPFFGVKKANEWGVGPFVALQSGSDKVIQSIGAGGMIGFKRESSSSSWNLGIGLMCDPQVKILGDGIEENKPLPAGETEVRYKTTDKWGLVFLTSFTF